jgi:hypothetical protein
VRLSAPAPSGGMTINLSSNKPAIVHVQSSVTVPAGADFATFDIETAAVASMTSARISAFYGGVTRRTAVRIGTQSSEDEDRAKMHRGDASASRNKFVPFRSFFGQRR